MFTGCVLLEPQQGMTYRRYRELCRRARTLGLGGTFRSDHYVPLWGPIPQERPTDAWATVCSAASSLESGVLGVLVSPVGFRSPGQLSTMVMTAEAMSAGTSIEVGVGIGWFEAEHALFGFPFPDVQARFGVLDDYLRSLTSLLRRGNSGTPPVEPVAPSGWTSDARVIVGGAGGPRHRHLALSWADELNFLNLPPADLRRRVAQCEAEGAARRGGEALRFSWTGRFAIGRTVRQALDRAAQLGAPHGRTGEEQLRSEARRGMGGDLKSVVRGIREMRSAGVHRIIGQHWLSDDDEHLELFAEAIAEAT